MALILSSVFFQHVGPLGKFYASCETDMMVIMYLFHKVLMRTESTIWTFRQNDRVDVIYIYCNWKKIKTKTSHKQIRNDLEWQREICLVANNVRLAVKRRLIHANFVIPLLLKYSKINSVNTYMASFKL